MDIIEKIRAAGVVGCGGAGFPTHQKLSGPMEYLIINGAECEPLLRTDRYLMLHKAPRLVKAITALGTHLNIPNLVIAVKHHYNAEIAALRAAIAQANAPIRIHELESFYPAGDEQTIVYEVTGRVVPPGGIPIAAGCVVDNVATIYSVSLAMEDLPFTQKYLTVTGEVNKPAILRVPIGTGVRECLALSGGAKVKNYIVMTGGPMMGRVIPGGELDTAVVTKTTSSLLVLPEGGYHHRAAAADLSRMVSRARSACIQCTSCTQLCPRHMLGHPIQPHRIMRKMAMGGSMEALLLDPDIRSAQLCCQCGVCETYACPMGLFPRKINAMLKEELGKAGIRYIPPETPVQPSPHRESRKVPSEKAAARAGVRSYYGYEITDLVTAAPTRVEIPVKMHIGAPAIPTVQAGDRVALGDVIACPPQGALGAVVHASISGRVAAVGERIVIEKE